MKAIDTELLVGLIVLLGAGVLIYLSFQLGQIGLVGNRGYEVHADFTTAGGLQNGAEIQLAGVEIGRVKTVDLVDYQARIVLEIDPAIRLPKDTQAAIKSHGLIGERYVEITPGTATDAIPPGGQIQKTESPVDIQETIAQFIFGNVGGSTGQEGSASDGTDPWALDLD